MVERMLVFKDDETEELYYIRTYSDKSLDAIQEAEAVLEDNNYDLTKITFIGED